MTKLTRYDPAAALTSKEEIAYFLTDALETNDPAYIANALGIVARAQGMSDVSKKTGLSREQLYKTFSFDGNPTLKTILSVFDVLGLHLTARTH